jgi:hypothetical protein
LAKHCNLFDYFHRGFVSIEIILFISLPVQGRPSQMRRAPKTKKTITFVDRPWAVCATHDNVQKNAEKIDFEAQWPPSPSCVSQQQRFIDHGFAKSIVDVIFSQNQNGQEPGWAAKARLERICLQQEVSR